MLSALILGTLDARAQCIGSVLTDISFGTVDLSSGAAIDSTATYSYSGCGSFGTANRNCSSIGAGSNADGTSRRLRVGSSYLRYQIYSDAARTIVWGSELDGYGGGTAVTVNTIQPSTTRTIYVRVLPNQQAVAGGNYSDSIVSYNVSVTNPTTACPQTGGIVQNQVRAVSAFVIQSCVVSAGNLGFGTAAALSAVTDATSAITLSCVNGVPWRVALSGGGEVNTAARRMASGANRIAYSLFRDAGRTQNWGNSVSDERGGTGTGANQVLTVYGRVPVQTTPPAGAYSDTIVVTVTY